jgi:hypothetical protein
MKIRMTRSYTVFESYEPIEINPEDYPEFEGKTEDEILEYINDNAYDFKVKGGGEENIVDEIIFGNDIIKDSEYNEELTFNID